MELKDFGDASFGPATPDEVNERLTELAARVEARRSRFGAEPISTGSLALDRATGIGGLPRGRIVTLVGTVAGSDALALSAVAQVQKRDGVVAILDPGSSLRPQLAGHPDVDLEHLLLLRPETEEEVVEAVLSLVEQRAADLVVVTGLHTALGRLSDAGSDMETLGDEALLAAVERLAAALASSPTTVLLLRRSGRRGAGGSTPARVRAAIDRIVGLQLESKTVQRQAGPLLGVNVASRREASRSARVSLDRSGAVSRLGDLLETATADRLIERRGSTYHYAGRSLGRGREEAKRALEEAPDLAFQIESALERSNEAMRRGSVAMEAALPRMREPDDDGEDSPEPLAPLPHPPAHDVGGAFSFEPRQPDPDRDQPGDAAPAPAPAPRHVNTWFEGEAPVLPLAVGREAPFHLQIGVRRSHAAGTAAPFVEPDWGGKDWLDLLVSLYSDDFRIEPRQQRFHMPRLGESEVLTFRCTPLRAGPCRLRIVLSLAQELEVLQRLHVEVAAAETGRGAVEAG